MNIDQLRSIVRNREPKMKQIHIILVCLNFVDDNPEYAPSVGCLWNTENTFLIHSGIFGKFINRKANTINRNFRTHGFKRKKSSCLMREQIPKKFNLHDLPDAANWFQRECQGFSKKTTEKESIKWEFHQIIPKKHIEKIEPKEKKIEDDFIDFSNNNYYNVILNYDIKFDTINNEKNINGTTVNYEKKTENDHENLPFFTNNDLNNYFFQDEGYNENNINDTTVNYEKKTENDHENLPFFTNNDLNNYFFQDEGYNENNLQNFFEIEDIPSSPEGHNNFYELSDDYGISF